MFSILFSQILMLQFLNAWEGNIDNKLMIHIKVKYRIVSKYINITILMSWVVIDLVIDLLYLEQM